MGNGPQENGVHVCNAFKLLLACQGGTSFGLRADGYDSAEIFLCSLPGFLGVTGSKEQSFCFQCLDRVPLLVHGVGHLVSDRVTMGIQAVELSVDGEPELWIPYEFPSSASRTTFR